MKSPFLLRLRQTFLFFFLVAYLTCLPGVQAFESAADYVDSLGGKVNFWHPEKMPLRVFIQIDLGVPNFKARFKDYFLDACKAWAEASGQKISFKFVEKAPYDIRVYWTSDTTSLNKEGELGESSWSSDQNGLYQAVIKLLTIGLDGRSPISDQEAKLMCLHELGHALGLAKHSPYPSDIMAACIDYNYNTPVSALHLSERDKRTIFRLYDEGDELVEKLSAASGDPQAKIMRLCFRASKLEDEGQFDTATVLLERALAIDPQSKPGLRLLGSITFAHGMELYEKGDYSRAKERLEKFLDTCIKLKSEDRSLISQAKETIGRCKSKLKEQAR